VTGLGGRFELGRLQLIREGAHLLLITMGSIASEVVSAAAVLADRGLSCTVAVVASVNPAPVEDLAALLARFPLALTVEAHYVSGAVGSLVSEVVAERGLGCRVVRCGVRTTPGATSGSQGYLHHAHGLSSNALVQTALKEVEVQRAST
jgi:transketolase